MTTVITVPQQRASFRVEHLLDEHGVRLLVQQLMPCMQDAHMRSRAGISMPFNPDVDRIVAKMITAVDRWITARLNGNIVAYQQWTVINNELSRDRAMAVCIAIWKMNHDVCDTRSFLQYGITAMRGIGVSDVFVIANDSTPIPAILEALGGVIEEQIVRV